MNELAARIADGWAPDLTPAEKAAMETDLHAMQCREPAGECVQCMKTWHAVRKFINAATPHIEAAERARLAGEGSLHPAGSEHRVQLELRWYRPDGTYHPRAAAEPDLDPDPLQTLRDHLRSGLPEGFVRGEIWSKEHWAGPWEVVPEEEINDG